MITEPLAVIDRQLNPAMTFDVRAPAAQVGCQIVVKGCLGVAEPGYRWQVSSGQTYVHPRTMCCSAQAYYPALISSPADIGEVSNSRYNLMMDGQKKKDQYQSRRVAT